MARPSGPDPKGLRIPTANYLTGLQKECSGADFAMGELIVHRTWNVDRDNFLVGVSHAQRWVPGVNNAICANCGSGQIRKRSSSCDHGTAGFYAYHDSNEVYSGAVYGIIKAYGLTTVGTKGIRAEKAEIVAVYDPTAPDKPDANPMKIRGVKNRLSKALWRNDKVADDWGFGAGLILAMVAAYAIPFGLAMGFLALFIFGLTLLPFSFLSINAELAANKRLPKKTVDGGPRINWEKVRENYPDVEFWNDKKAMLKAHPLNKEQ